MEIPDFFPRQFLINLKLQILMHAPIASTQHPLSPLEPEEIRRAVEILRFAGHAQASTRFVCVMLHEPDRRKDEPGAREAFCVLLDRDSGKTFEAVVNLDAGGVSRIIHIPSVQPAITMDEFFECEEMLRAHPEFQAAVRKRGINDFGLLMIDPWSTGSYHSDNPAHAGRRLVRALTWVRSEPGENGYTRPLEGLRALVDLNSSELVHLEDTGVVALPPEPSNYAPPFLATRKKSPAPLEISQPEGPGFRVDRHLVEWEGWSFRVGFTPREGLVLYEVSCEGRPVMARAALVDMIVPYGDPHENHARKNAFDCGEYGIGMLANSLTLGCDCLGVIRYFDAHLVNSRGEPLTIKNAICLHEEDYGILWKHTDWRTNATELRRSRRLVISFIATVGNYEYGFFWYFYLDGTIQHEVKLTGIMNTGALPVGEKRKYGTMVAPGLYTPIHQHIFSYKLDMSVDGIANTVHEINTHAEPAGPENPYNNGFYAEATPLLNETARDIDITSARYWKVVNPNVRNAHGEPTAYKIMFGENAFPFVRPDSSVRKRAGYIDHHLWVTPYEPSEKFAAGEYPNQRSPEIQDGLPAWIQNGRSTDNTALVCWLTVNSHHVPRPEDWPVMPCSYIGFHLKPAGFFDRNPSIDLPPSQSKHSVDIGKQDGESCCGGV